MKKTNKIGGVLGSEVQKVVSRVKTAQKQFQEILSQRERAITEVRKYADERGKEVKKIMSDDLKKVKSFIARERKELEKLQKRLPDEITKIKGYVESQRKELEGLWKRITEPTQSSDNSKASLKAPSTSSSKKQSSVQPVSDAVVVGDGQEASQTASSSGSSKGSQASTLRG